MLDEIIWKSVKSGDSDAFRDIYNKYSDEMFRYGFKLSGSTEIVEDAIQNVFINIYRLRNNLSQPSSLKAYLLGALKNEILMNCKQSQKRSEITEDCDISEMAGRYDFNLDLDPESLIIASENHQIKLDLLQSAINRLPERQKEAVYLRYYNNLSGQEIAEIMNINHQSVRSTLAKALNNLREELGVSEEILISMLIYFFTL